MFGLKITHLDLPGKALIDFSLTVLNLAHFLEDPLDYSGGSKEPIRAHRF